MSNIESIIFENLIHNVEYFRTVIPHLKEEYFESRVDRLVFKFIKVFSEKYSKAPTIKILNTIVQEFDGFSQPEFEEASTLISNMNGKEENLEWLTNRTEEYCKERAIYLAIMASINIIDGNDKKMKREGIPLLLQEALAISFDTSVGQDYLQDTESQWEYYHLKEKKVPFPLDILNKITDGGVSSKTLNVYLMATNVGKSLTMCDHAVWCINNGYKALYITAEMAQEKIAQRIDCNLLNVTPKELKLISKERYLNKFDTIKSNVKGNLVIKEYPTSTAHVGHFRSLLEELKMKRNFKPDIIFVDYINICASQRLNRGNSNSYEYIKAICEELRGLAVEYDVPIISATQTNKSSWGGSDIEMSDTSESGGLPMTVDLLLGGVRTEELDKMNQIMFRQLKSRYGDVNFHRKFVVGVEISKFKLYDIEESFQGHLSESGRTDNTVNNQQVGGAEYSAIDFS